MRQIFKNKKIRISGFAIVLTSIISVGIFMQSCDSSDSPMNEFNTSDIEAINSIKSQDLQIVLESVFQITKEANSEYSICIVVCEDLVSTIKATQAVKGAGDSKQIIRLKGSNPETVAQGWTYLGEIHNNLAAPAEAISMYNKYKKKWNYACLELRLETVGNIMNVYVRTC
jgi:hypothetical protein